MKRLTSIAAFAALTACGGDATTEATAPAPEASAAVAQSATMPARSLADILAAQPEDAQARYVYRKPQATLEFFGIEPGMTVVEGLPGGGWYSKILLPYLGSDGMLIGADYPLRMFEVNPSTTPERLEAKKNWVADWTAQANGWRGDGDATIAAFQMAALPDDMKGTADAVLFVRALHNLARWEEAGGTLTSAATDAYDVLKPGGVVGVIQHEARPDMPDEWADGSKGYLKRGFVVETMQAAGFELVGSSDMHENELDQPTIDDIVWRLPPSLSTSREDPELREQLAAIGESNRMTLLFRKPGA